MPNPDTVTQQQELLSVHRQTLTVYLRQQAMLGVPYTPPAIAYGIREARENIQRIKSTLRDWGVAVENLPDDEEPSSEPVSSRLQPEDEEERRNLREVIRAYQGRLRVLEIQQAKRGINSPPEIIIEIQDIRQEINRAEKQLNRLIPSVDRDMQRQRRGQALTAFYAKDWKLAEELLEQVIQANPNDQDAQAKLEQVQRQLDMRALYQSFRKLRDEGLWQALLDALDDLAREYPGAPDSDGLRAWAEWRKQRSEQYAAVVDSLEVLVANDPSDNAARAMLTQARATRDEGR